MNKGLKSKWIKALRSGKYRQGGGVLQSPDGSYCCLGVLRTLMHRGSKKSVGGYGELLCDKHAKEAGLSMRQQTRLANMNDRGKSFSFIADYIEKKL